MSCRMRGGLRWEVVGNARKAARPQRKCEDAPSGPELVLGLNLSREERKEREEMRLRRRVGGNCTECAHYLGVAF